MTPELIVVYRAVGKLSYGHNGPTHTTAVVEEADALKAGAQLVTDGVWVEFNVKKIYRHRRTPSTVA